MTTGTGTPLNAPASPSSLNGSGPVAAGRLGIALPTRQRRTGLVALLVALMVGLGAVGASLYASAGSKVAVVMVVRTVPAGQVISRADLTSVPVSGPVVAFGANRLAVLVGQRAAVPLQPNMFLQRSMVTSGDTLPPGQAAVGVAVRSGQIPADGLTAGDVVQVVQLPAKDGAGAAQVLVARAVVFSARPDPAVNGGTLLTVIVPAAASTGVAAASSAGQVALVRVGSS
jgi:hypothetical protein